MAAMAEITERRSSLPSFDSIWNIFELVLLFCNNDTLFAVRLVCRRWYQAPWFAWPLTRAFIAEKRSRGFHCVSLRLAVLAVHRATERDFDWIEESAALVSQKGHQTVVVVQENERYVPGRGYTKSRLPSDPPPWVQICGAHTGEIVDLHAALLGGGQWSGSWRLMPPKQSATPSSDADEAWVYGSSFRALSREQPLTALTGVNLVRRRHWVRLAEYAPQWS